MNYTTNITHIYFTNIQQFCDIVSVHSICYYKEILILIRVLISVNASGYD